MGENYCSFDREAVEFRDRYQLQPQEVDWVLTSIASYVASDDGNFQIDDDFLATKDLPVVPDDESDLDDLVGQPMELRVMRWSPTNEMGVIACL